MRIDVKQAIGGRWFLEVGGVALAVEGDFCRDPRIAAVTWTRYDLERVAQQLRAAADTGTPLVVLS